MAGFKKLTNFFSIRPLCEQLYPDKTVLFFYIILDNMIQKFTEARLPWVIIKYNMKNTLWNILVYWMADKSLETIQDHTSICKIVYFLALQDCFLSSI